MALINAGRLVARALKNEGVEVVFGLVGGHITSLFYGCRDEGIQVVDCRHECAAAYAADAYARATGKPGVVITTAGPGILDATTAMAEAQMIGTPVIHIGGAGAVAFLETGSLQCLETINTMKTVTKWAKRLYTGPRAAEYVSMAFRHALDDTPGPVYLEIPADVLATPFDEDTAVIPVNYRTEAHAFGDPELIDEAADILAAAKKPVIVIGDIARYSAKHGEYVVKLAEHLQIPVIVSNVARGVFSDEHHPLFSINGRCMSEADVIVEIGVNNNYLIRKGKAPFFNADAKIIQIHPDKSMIGYNTRADVGIVAGAGAAAKQLYEAVIKRSEGVAAPGWTQEAIALGKEYNDILQSSYTSENMPMHPARCAAEVAKFIETEGKDWTVVCDGGEASLWSSGACKSTYPGQVVTFGPLGTIGTGPGFTLGSWFANKKPLLYYTGDGSFGFYPMEFDTYARNNIPVVCVIANDSAWGVIKLLEEKSKPDYIKEKGHVGSTLSHMRRYEKLADMWGGLGITVTAPEDIIPAIKKVAATGKPGIVNVEIDDSILSPMTGGGSLSIML